MSQEITFEITDDMSFIATIDEGRFIMPYGEDRHHISEPFYFIPNDEQIPDWSEPSSSCNHYIPNGRMMRDHFNIDARKWGNYPLCSMMLSAAMDPVDACLEDLLEYGGFKPYGFPKNRNIKNIWVTIDRGGKEVIFQINENGASVQRIKGAGYFDPIISMNWRHYDEVPFWPKGFAESLPTRVLMGGLIGMQIINDKYGLRGGLGHFEASVRTRLTYPER
jgi:hypothetical protein